ncbi:MAG: hydantoinase/oxoprolinase family protein [Chloroflexia bacterium]|nr:hydantoinase/oxoprolinase family protein [Chloroflexia bacterium]
MNPAASTLVGIDVGGTFTDFVVLSGDQLRVHKCTTTPADQSQAILAGLAELGLGTGIEIVHGCTVATNALLERRGARTALLTTAGFADLLVIGRQNRPWLYRLSQQIPPALVPAAWRMEVTERLDADGKVLCPLDEAAVAALAGRLGESDIESLAIVFLFSFRNPVHEERAAEIIGALLPDLPLSLSSAILPEYREYERTATTVIHAYVQPLVARYLDRLAVALGRRRVRMMQSNGGAIGLSQAAAQAGRLVLSGPAGGVVGAFHLAQQAQGAGGAASLITLDMGGTSTDVALCPGQIPYTSESEIAGLPLRLPSIDIHTVGAGGGSLARVDAAGVLRVGPQSAGADPGPVCYGRGGSEPTVTDANLVLGRLDPAHFLGGRGNVRIDLAAARAALAHLGRQLGLSAEAAALGVIRVANATMERALRRVSIERGFDPREFSLVPFGGAGPLHACELAGALGIRRVLIPPHPGVLSALGLLIADLIYDAACSVLGRLEALQEDLAPLRDTWEALQEQVSAVLRREGVTRPRLEAALDLRYCGQSYELTVPLRQPLLPDSLEQAAADFHVAHARRYGYAMAQEPLEVVTLRLRGIGPGTRPALPRYPLGPEDPAAASLGHRPVCFLETAPLNTACYERSALSAGQRFAGPALVLQYDTTTVVPPGWQVRVDAWENLCLQWRASAESS